jgi:hypothetical protein
LDKRKTGILTIFIILTALIILLGGYFEARAMRWGPWAFSDSAAYVSAARNFTGGKGFVIINSNNSITQVTEFPPLYPFLLSLFLGKDGDPNIAIRWLNLALFAVFIASAGFILYSITQDLFLSILGELGIMVFPIMTQTFSSVMSETLFIPLLYIILLTALFFLQKRSKWIFVLLVFFSMLLPLTRYAGILFVVTTALLILIFYQDRIRVKSRLILCYLTASLLPVGLWFLKLYLLSDKVGGKRFTFDPALLSGFFESVQSEFKVLSTWLPYYGVYKNNLLDILLLWGFLVLFAALAVVVIIHPQKHPHKPLDLKYILFTGTGIHLMAYLIFIAFTHTITVPQIDIIDRMLAPIYPMMVLFLVVSLSILVEKKNIPLYLGIMLVSIFIIRFYTLKSNSYIADMESSGHGYSARQYQESGIIDQLEALPENQRMISNSAGFVLYYTNRFPLQIDQFANHTYGIGKGYGEEWMREKDAVLILLYPDFRNYYGDTATQLLQTITNGLTVIYEDEVSGIYTYPD